MPVMNSVNKGKYFLGDHQSLGAYLWSVLMTFGESDNGKEKDDEFDIEVKKDEVLQKQAILDFYAKHSFTTEDQIVPRLGNAISDFELDLEAMDRLLSGGVLVMGDVLDVDMLSETPKYNSKGEDFLSAYYWLMLKADLKFMYVRKDISSSDGRVLHFIICADDDRSTIVPALFADLMAGKVKV